MIFDRSKLTQRLIEEKRKLQASTRTEPLEKVQGYTRQEMYQVVTDKMPVLPIGRGIDTCEKMGIILHWSGVYVWVYIVNIGFCRVLDIRQLSRYKCEIKTMDILGHEKWVPLPWNTEFHLFLGEP